MAPLKRCFTQELLDRNILYQSTPLDTFTPHFDTAGRRVYAGFDPTADSLHVGHLLLLVTLRRFQIAGHTPFILVGGATGLVGDPSFKAQERNLNPLDVARSWTEKLGHQMSRFIELDTQKASGVLVNNYDWLGKLDLLSFLRDVGKQFSVNAMIQKESVKQRLQKEQMGISFAEFSYGLLQAYDFYHLFKAHGVTCQLGGADQWGNISSGINLISRLEKAPVHGMTLPLLTKSDGSKFGKTEQGTVWLDADKTSPYAFYHFWRQTPDADVYKLLRQLSFLPLEAITELESADRARIHGAPEAARILAEAMTEWVHGKEALQSVLRLVRQLFQQDLTGLTASDFAQLDVDGLSLHVSAQPFTMLDALVETGLATSKSQAKDLIKAGAVCVNGRQIKSLDPITFTLQDRLFNQYTLIQKGKKYHRLLVWQR